MGIKIKNRLSIKIVALTVLMASMTLISTAVGILSLNEFKVEYQQIKSKNFDLLLKMGELKAQTDSIIQISTEMFLSKNANELQWDTLEFSDKKLWIDKIFNQLVGHTKDHQELLILKLRLYSHLDEISRAVTNKFIFSNDFFRTYAEAEALKKEMLEKDKLDLYIILDSAISHFNPIVNKHLELSKSADIEALETYVKSIAKQLNSAQAARLQTLFIDESSLSVSYQKYAQQLIYLEELRLKNEEFTDQFVAVLGDNVQRIQDKFVVKLIQIEGEIEKRKNRLYIVVLSCLLVTLMLLLLQLDFIKRIHLIRKIINAGDTHRVLDFPINRKDELSQMALSVRTYIERLVEKEKEVLAINKQLSHVASHDALTGTYNRGYFDDYLMHEHARYLRYKEVYCLAMFDLDLFKKVNDTFGHDGGDKVLIEFTKRVESMVRKTDVFARFGGEEFILVMPNTLGKHALLLMERIRTAIASAPCVYGNKMIPFTVSIGLVQVQNVLDNQEASKQVSFADKALYEAKHAGRNRVCVYQD